ncbi:hypothetical protein WN55_10886 [Dufourea novaeangliae]|uniref:Uncharacterized protein n=1 Tax=Dufourea novaeangliae TaxID=178035 RepID=A0A154P859_DUFNO|nr:hypothetical protein WN55_10886 [Dufourea novaeangliae]
MQLNFVRRCAKRMTNVHERRQGGKGGLEVRGLSNCGSRGKNIIEGWQKTMERIETSRDNDARTSRIKERMKFLGLLIKRN